MNHWVMWGIKLVASLILSVGVVWGVSFGVANYVVKASTNSLQSSIDNLNASLTALDGTVASINSNLSQQLLVLQKDKGDLAVSIAQEVGKLQLSQGLQAQDIARIREEFQEVAQALVPSNATRGAAVRVTFDGGKTFETMAEEEFFTKYGDTLKLGQAFAMTGGGFVLLPQ